MAVASPRGHGCVASLEEVDKHVQSGIGGDAHHWRRDSSARLVQLRLLWLQRLPRLLGRLLRLLGVQRLLRLQWLLGELLVLLRVLGQLLRLLWV